MTQCLSQPVLYFLCVPMADRVSWGNNFICGRGVYPRWEQFHVLSSILLQSQRIRRQQMVDITEAGKIYRFKIFNYTKNPIDKIPTMFKI